MNADEQGAGLPVTTVVELLDAVAADSEDAASDAFERLTARVPAEDAAVLVKRLRDLRSLLVRWRRRGHELSALFSSSRELAELRDTDALLHRLVERAPVFPSRDSVAGEGSVEPSSSDTLNRGNG